MIAVRLEHVRDDFAHPRARFVLDPLGDADQRQTGRQELLQLLANRSHPMRGNGEHHQLRPAQARTPCRA